MPNISPTQHQNYNNVTLIGANQTLGSIRFWDVGTGNCNSLRNSAGDHLVYYDFGGNFKAGGGVKTYPNPTPGFDLTQNPVFVISHWDGDHYYSLKKLNAAGQQIWLGTREDIAKEGNKLLNAKCAHLHAVVRGAAATYRFTTTAGVEIRLVRCQDPGTLNSSANQLRNNNGIALYIYLHSPARQLVNAMDAHAQANVNDPNGTAAAAGATGADIYKNLVVQAALGAVAGAGGVAAPVVTAARLALDAQVVKLMARAAIAAHTAATAQPNNAAYVEAQVQAITGSPATHLYLAGMLQAAHDAAQSQAGNAANAATQVEAALHPGIVTNPAAVAAVNMMKHALANPNDNEGTLNAGGNHNNDLYVKRVIEAAQSKSEENPVPTAQQVAQAAVDALAPAPQYTAVALVGDAAFQSIPGIFNHPWDLLLAYHHGTYEQFVRPQQHASNPPAPAVLRRSQIVYSSGKKGNTKVFDHPSLEAVTKYRQHGWTKEHYTTGGYQNNQHGNARGNRDITLP